MIEDALTNLLDLGLTPTQAKIYLVVLKENHCNFHRIAKLSQVARSEVYREVVSLEKAGLVEKTLERPKIVRAIPVEIALRSFVEHQKKKLESDISNLENVLIDFLKNNCPPVKRNFEVNSDNVEFALISQKNLMISKMMSMFDEAEEEVLIRYLPRKICAVLQFCSSSINNALKSNVDFNIITASDPFSNGLITTLYSNIDHTIGELEIKESSNVPFGLIIIDNKQLLLETKPEDFFSEKPMLWTNCPVLLSTMYRDFKQDWFNSKSSVELEPYLRT